MDDRTMNGVLSETRMREIVVENSTILAMKEELTLLRKCIESLNGTSEIATDIGRVKDRNIWTIGGYFRRVPPDWVFPGGTILNVYEYWIHGDEVKGIVPMRLLTRQDLAWCKGAKKRYPKNLDECRFIFSLLDAESKRLGLWKEKPSRAETIQAFYKAKDVWGITETTPQGKKRKFEKIAWSSIMRLMPKEKRLLRGSAKH